MNLVRMEKKGDCGPACLATVLGKTLQEVVAVFPEARQQGLSDVEMVDYLCINGVPALSSIEWPSHRIPAIVTVPSLNHPGLLHYMLWDGKEYLDPSNGSKRYPEDAPVITGMHGSGLSWASVILLWMDLD